MGSDTFLKLLVAQLKYQDPSKPADTTAMMAQTAQFQMVEKLKQLADQNTQMLSEQQATSAIALVGRSVSYTEGDQTQHGVVDSLRLTAGGPVLSDRRGARCRLSAISEITSASSAAPRRLTPDHLLPQRNSRHASLALLRRLRPAQPPDDDGRRRQQHRQRQHGRLQEQLHRVRGHAQPGRAAPAAARRACAAAPTRPRSASACGSAASPRTSARAPPRSPAGPPTW